MKRVVFSVLIALLSMLCQSCESQLDRALKQAGNNRAELEKVLKHFKDDPDPLKYQAAKFLIENMPYHYSYQGVGINSYDSLYLKTADEASELRHDFFNGKVDSIDLSKKRIAIDITSVKADYLIRIIDEACDVWEKVNWNNDYDSSIFFDYVLPYRLLNEPLSDWRNFLDNEYKFLKENAVWSRRGPQTEAEDAKYEQCKVVETESASQGKMVMLDKRGASVTFTIDSYENTRKNLFFRYTSTTRQNKMIVSLNGVVVDTLHLDPTKTLKTFRNSRQGLDIMLRNGQNTLSVSCAGDTIGLDFLMIQSIEPFNPNEQKDFSNSFYRISNEQTHHYISFDTLKTSILNIMELKPFVKNDSCQLLRLNYQGFPCWNICAFKTDSIDLCMEVQYCRTNADAPISLYKYLNGNHQKWVFIPVGKDLYKIMSKDCGFFLESKIDKETGKEIIVQNPYSGKNTQKWLIEKQGKNPYTKNLFQLGSAISEALRIYDITNLFEFIVFKGDIPPKATSLCKAKTGKCRDETDYVVYLCRYLGIPAAIDFTPHWGNRSMSHAWSVLIKPDGKSIPFYIGCTPGDTAQYYHSYKKPKIFRHRFQLNREYVKDFRREKEIPQLFKAADFIDVTDEYYTTTNVERDVPKEYSDKRVAYICVFDNREWVPVFYGNIHAGKVTFKSMGRGIVYMAAFYEQGRIKPFGEPFLIADNGSVRTISANGKKKQSMNLIRKYPFMGKQDFFNGRMSGGKFQGSNFADFSQHTDLYIHEGITNGNWYEIPIKDKGQYRYLRYIGPNGSYCNINELDFYDDKGKQIKGKIIGTEGEQWATKEKVFDGDILTGFSAISPDGHWVGLQLNRPVRVSKLHYIPRNDGNSIEIDDKYELYYWKNEEWTLLGTQKATKKFLVFRNMPSGGLYVLVDLTKGHEERIFTYEKGDQLWW